MQKKEEEMHIDDIYEKSGEKLPTKKFESPFIGMLLNYMDKRTGNVKRDLLKKLKCRDEKIKKLEKISSTCLRRQARLQKQLKLIGHRQDTLVKTESLLSSEFELLKEGLIKKFAELEEKYDVDCSQIEARLCDFEYQCLKGIQENERTMLVKIKKLHQVCESVLDDPNLLPPQIPTMNLQHVMKEDPCENYNNSCYFADDDFMGDLTERAFPRMNEQLKTEDLFLDVEYVPSIQPIASANPGRSSVEHRPLTPPIPLAIHDQSPLYTGASGSRSPWTSESSSISDNDDNFSTTANSSISEKNFESDNCDDSKSFSFSDTRANSSVSDLSLSESTVHSVSNEEECIAIFSTSNTNNSCYNETVGSVNAENNIYMTEGNVWFIYSNLECRFDTLNDDWSVFRWIISDFKSKRQNNFELYSPPFKFPVRDLESNTNIMVELNVLWHDIELKDSISIVLQTSASDVDSSLTSTSVLLTCEGNGNFHSQVLNLNSIHKEAFLKFNSKDEKNQQEELPACLLLLANHYSENDSTNVQSNSVEDFLVNDCLYINCYFVHSADIKI